MNSIPDDTEGLHRIANTDNLDRVADVVFVHGLRGSSHATWRYKKPGESEHFFWPAALGNELPNCGIWTVGYPAGITDFGNPGMIIEKRAGNIANQMVLSDLGTRPLFFIAHSMGGLIVKSLIVSSQLLDDSARKKVAGNVRGIVFCGTPHRGSAFASSADILGKVFGGTQAHVQQMAANAEALDLLHDKFLAWHRQHPVAVESYAENNALFQKTWWGRLARLGIVVPRASANPSVGPVHDVDADHLSLVKPAPAVPAIYTPVYKGVLRFLKAVCPRLETSAFNAVFNGKDLTGWRGAVGNFEVIDGAIRCKPGGGGILHTTEEYGNFVVRLEFRIPPAGNSGLAIRTDGTGDAAYAAMCEIQVLDSEHPKYAHLDPRQYHGSAYGIAAAARGFLRAADTWNFQEVTVDGSRITVELNGKIILNADLSTITHYMANYAHPGKDRKVGYFGFIGQNDPVCFRNISIMRLQWKTARRVNKAHAIVIAPAGWRCRRKSKRCATDSASAFGHCVDIRR